MITPSTRALLIAGILGTQIAMSVPQLAGQAANKDATAAVEGKVLDSQQRPVTAAEILLERADPGQILTFTSDSQGQFHFEGVPVGSYRLRAKLAGYQECTKGPFVLHDHETKSIVLLMVNAQTPASGKDESSVIAFSDEPAFTVAGVTDTTALGGHGSGPIVRNSNALSKETASLVRESATAPRASPREPVHGGPTQEAAIRAMLAQEDTADLHARLAEIEESEGRPLEAVQDYQRAAEMQPSEPHLFAWGAELLLHHAPEPAIEVFAKGHRLYPQSSRMMLGLGAAFYAQRSKEQAVQTFLEACDLNPADPTPYLFLGRLQTTEQVVPSGWTERMKRFASFHPETAMAHELYAVALMKQGGNPERLTVEEAELKTAIKLDPHFSEAYLQLGILRSEQDDIPGAIAELQKAVAFTPVPEEAHYRLAQVYRRMGETDKARKEIELFKQLSEQKNEETERERHEIPQFVYTLREQSPASQPPAPDSH
jgi:tetratricopeptide (TPR) repeat protein